MTMLIDPQPRGVCGELADLHVLTLTTWETERAGVVAPPAIRFVEED